MSLWNFLFPPSLLFKGSGGPPEKDTLKSQQSKAWGTLGDISSFGFDTAKSSGAKGFDIQDDATKYFQSLLGDTNLGEKLSAPAINATREGADAAKVEQASLGTGRVGGVNAGNQAQESDIMGQINSLLQGGDIAALSLKGDAAGQLANIGAEDIQAMLQALGISTGAAGTLGEQTTGRLNQKDAASAQKWASLIKGIADIASAGIV